MKEPATIQKSLDRAKESFMEWHSIATGEFPDQKEREEKAVAAIMALSDVISRASMKSFGDLLTSQELKAVHQSMMMIRTKESDDVFKKSLHHAVQRLLENFTQSLTDEQ